MKFNKNKQFVVVTSTLLVLSCTAVITSFAYDGDNQSSSSVVYAATYPDTNSYILQKNITFLH